MLVRLLIVTSLGFLSACSAGGGSQSSGGGSQQPDSPESGQTEGGQLSGSDCEKLWASREFTSLNDSLKNLGLKNSIALAVGLLVEGGKAEKEVSDCLI